MWDFRTRRLTVLGPEGGLAGTVRMEETEEVRIPFLQARPPDGSFLATAANVFMAGDVRSGLVREPTRYVRFGADGSALGPVLTLPGSEAVVVSGEGGPDCSGRPGSRDRRRSFESLGYPPVLPAYPHLEVDALGHLWVQDYRPPGVDEGPGTWLVYDPKGRILGAIELPEGLDVLELRITGGYRGV